MSHVRLFGNDAGTDIIFENIRGEIGPRFSQAKRHCEGLWELFEVHADPEFPRELRSNFAARYWEMYLTTTLMKLGFEVTCPKPGPDVGVMVSGTRIWFEAVTPTRGAEGSPDQVPEPRTGEVSNFPEDQILLRHLNSISEKFQRQYPRWLSNKVVDPSDVFIIAINCSRLHHGLDTDPPIALKLALGVGHMTIKINRDTLAASDVGFTTKFEVAKVSGANVNSGLFVRDDYVKLSAILMSGSNVANLMAIAGEEFQLIANPRSTNPLPAGFRLPGTCFDVREDDNSYNVTRRHH